MKKTILPLLIIVLLPCSAAMGQCAADENIFSFAYNSKTYEIIKENKTWVEAAACASSRGGYLAEINDAGEQQAIFEQLQAANINSTETVATDGFGSYIWLGGNDISTEGFWALNGNNDDQALFFWQGNANGTPLNNRYNNWGNEPDNWGASPGQDALGMAIIPFPNGAAGEWNDLNHNNALYFVVEHSTLMSQQADTFDIVSIYPNPASTTLTITGGVDSLNDITIYNVAGQLVRELDNKDLTGGEIDVDALPAGIYLVQLTLKNGTQQTKKLLIE